MKTSKGQHQQQGNGELAAKSFSKLLSSEIASDKDRLCDVLHWSRQALGLFCGILWGAIPLVGAFWILVFLALSTSIIYGYYAYVLKVDEEELGGHASLLQEGMFASFTLFLLAWIIVYSLVHF